MPLFLRFLGLFLLHLNLCHGISFVKKPRSAVAEEGGNVYFNLTVEFAQSQNDAIRWQKINLDRTEKVIYQTYPSDYKYDTRKYQVISSENGSFTFGIKDLKMADAGQYKFGFIVFGDVYRKVDLVVVRKPWNFKETTKLVGGELANLTCEVEYNARPGFAERLTPEVYAKVGDVIIYRNNTEHYKQQNPASHAVVMPIEIRIPCEPEVEFFCVVESSKFDFYMENKMILEPDLSNLNSTLCESSGFMHFSNSLLLMVLPTVAVLGFNLMSATIF